MNITATSFDRVQPKGNQQSVLRDGQIVQGSILKIYPQNKAEIQIGNQKMIAEVTTPLAIGERYFFKVEHTDNIVQLRVIGDPLKQDSNINMTQLMDKLGIKVTKGNMQLVQTLINEKIPFDAAQLARAVELSDSATDKQAAVSAIKEMLINKLPMTNNVFQALMTRDGNTMNKMITNLISELKQVANPSESQQKLLHLLENLISRPAEGQAAVINQIVAHLTSDNNQLVSLLKLAGVVNLNTLLTNEHNTVLLQNQSTSVGSQPVNLQNQPVLVDVLAQLSNQAETLPSAARMVVSIFHPIHSGELSNQQFTAMQSMIETRIMPQLPEAMQQVLASLLTENTAGNQAQILNILQTLQASDTYQIAQNIVTNMESGSRFHTSPLQEQFLNHLQQTIQTSGLLDENVLTKNATQAQNVFQQSMEALVNNNQAVQAEAKEILTALNNVLQQNQAPTGTQLAAINAQIAERILPLLSAQHSQAIVSELQANSNNPAMIQQLLQTMASPTTFEQLEHFISQNNQLLLSQVTPEMKVLLQSMQLPLEQMQLGNPQENQSQTIKSLLLQMAQQNEALPGDRGQQLVHFINGLQIQSVQETNNLLHAQIQIPGEKIGLNKDLFMQFEGRKKENGEIDADYCRILFVLHLKNLDETIIDMNVQKRTVSITIFNNDVDMESFMTTGLRKTLADGLQNLNYHLTNIKWKQLHETEAATSPVEQRLYEQDATKERYDFRI